MVASFAPPLAPQTAGAPTLLNAFDEAAMERTDAKEEWHRLVLPYRVASTRRSLFQLFSNLALVVVFVELWAIVWIQNRYMQTPFLRATFQVVLGGALVFAAGALIGGG